MDLDIDVPGLETVATSYSSYPPGGAIELWSIISGDHCSPLSPIVSRQAIDWLLAHPKP